MIKPHEQWFYFAEQDLAFAAAGQRDGFYAHVCMLAQQAVEKAMKGYLVAKDRDYPKTHGLITLHRMMEIDWLESHLSAIKQLAEFYLPLRYPDAVAGVMAEGLPDEAMARDALTWAGDIVQQIRQHLTNNS